MRRVGKPVTIATFSWSGGRNPRKVCGIYFRIPTGFGTASHVAFTHGYAPLRQKA